MFCSSSSQWEELRDSIFSLQPINKSIELCESMEIFTNITLQNLLIKNILKCEIQEKYSLPCNYLKQFLCKLIKTIEFTGNEVSDELYVLLSQVICKDSSKTESHSHILLYVPYSRNRLFKNLKDNKCLKTIENENFGPFVFSFEDCNLVGMRPWPAGFRLVEWLIHSSNLNRSIYNSDIIELGSGIGISSIIPFIILPISSICSTDYDPKIVSNLRYNYSVNGIQFEEELDIEPNFKEKKTGAKVICFDWETVNIDFTDNLVKFSRNPIVISSDVIYENNLTFFFVKALKFLLASSFKKVFGYFPDNFINNNSDLKSVKWSELPQTNFDSISTYAVSINSLRSEATIQYFVDCCIENGLKISIDSTPTPIIFRYELNAPIVVFIVHY